MNKYGWGREAGRRGDGRGDTEEACEMHGPRKSTCMLALTVATRYSRYIQM